MTLQVHKVKWQVSLSNGKTVFEDKGDFKLIPGELSPWNRLLKYVEDNSLTITSLSLYTDDGRTFNLPSLGKNPKFSAFDIAQKPYKFSLERKYAADINTDDGTSEKQDSFTTICAWYKFGEVSLKLSIWVDESNTKNCWCLVNTLGEEG